MSVLPYLYNAERPLSLMERDLFEPDHFFNQLVPQEFFRPRSLDVWQNSVLPWSNILKPMEQLSAAMHQLALDHGSITADDEKFQVNVDVQHFSPEEVSVKVIDGSVIVQGKHEEKLDQHGYVSRQFVRKYPLPKGCLPDTVESKLSSDGVLTITAPKVLPLPSIGERIVPIKPTGPIKKTAPPERTGIENME